MKDATYCVFETPLGWCGVAWTDGAKPGAGPAVRFFQLPESSEKATAARIARKTGAREAAAPPPSIKALIKAVKKHLKGDVQDFDGIALDLDGVDPFARGVYEIARQIPTGQTRTYGDIAKALNLPNAARDVGEALGKNPIALIVPCHRVVAAGGKPGGFSAHGGQATKAKMLALEGATIGPPITIKSLREFNRAAKSLRERDPKLARCMDRPIEFITEPGHAPYDVLFEAVVRQQLSVKAASTILGRVKAIHPGPSVPAPKVLLKTPDETLREAGLSRAKTASIKDLAAKSLEGLVPGAEEIVLLGDEAIVRRLTAIRGIGRWTVEMLLIFHLGRMDILPVDDYALRRGVADVYKLKELPTAKEFMAIGEKWRPHRTVASLYLWNHINPRQREMNIEA